MEQSSAEGDIVGICDVIRELSGVDGLSADRDFYEAGVTSVQALPLLMELESRFEVTIPDDQFISARTPRELYNIVSSLKRP